MSAHGADEHSFPSTGGWRTIAGALFAVFAVYQIVDRPDRFLPPEQFLDFAGLALYLMMFGFGVYGIVSGVIAALGRTSFGKRNRDLLGPAPDGRCMGPGRRGVRCRPDADARVTHQLRLVLLVTSFPSARPSSAGRGSRKCARP
jgi:hypothetical protein